MTDHYVPDDLVTIRERHVESAVAADAVKPRCRYCRMFWPCDTAVLLSHIERQERHAEGLFGALTNAGKVIDAKEATP